MSAQRNTKTKGATKQTTLFLIGLTFLAMIEKSSKHKLKKEIFIFVKILYELKIVFLLVIFESFLSIIGKNNV